MRVDSCSVSWYYWDTVKTDERGAFYLPTRSAPSRRISAGTAQSPASFSDQNPASVLTDGVGLANKRRGVLRLGGIMIVYEEYLKSPEWQIKRQKTLEYYEYRCALCYSDEQLDVHHRTYIRLGNELPSDLIALCDDCHTRHHQIIKENEKLLSFWARFYWELANNGRNGSQ